MTKKQGFLIGLAIIVFIFPGCSDNTSISKQNEGAITNKTNTSINETLIISTTNTSTEETIIPSATNTSTEENLIPSTTNTTTEETLIPSTKNTSDDSRAMEKNDSTSSTDTYSNPIDAYFIPRINKASSGKKSYQDTYRGVWKAEFENILKVIDQKCVYQKDKDDLIAYKNSVEQLIKSTQEIVETDWLNNYNVPPPETDTYRNPPGNGTRSGLGQIKAEIYRDASMLLIEKMYDLNYKFLDKDYSKEHYE